MYRYLFFIKKQKWLAMFTSLTTVGDEWII